MGSQMGTSILIKKPKLQSAGLCTPRDAANDSGGRPSPRDDVVMDRILETMNAVPWDAIVTRIGSLPGVRRGKVLSIRRQMMKGTYRVEGRLEDAAERVLEDALGIRR
jgi:hypothetical protein